MKMSVDLVEVFNSLKTQKRLGIEKIQSCTGPLRYMVHMPPNTVLTLPWQIHYLRNKMEGGKAEKVYFARPCPRSPRHGFVDSREVRNLEEIIMLWREVLKHDVNGELMLCHKLSGEYSAIACPNMLVVGKGNDGATGGKVGNVSFPVFSTAKDWKLMGIVAPEQGPDEVPYIEIVKDCYKMVAVQMRCGPTPPMTADYVPEDVEVHAVITPSSEDLLEWERICKNCKGGNGAVVYLKDSNLASHWAVHAIQNKIPVITSRKPKVGDTLNKSGGGVKAPDNVDVEGIRVELKKLFEEGGFSFGRPREFIRLILFMVHHSLAWPYSPAHNLIRAYGVVGSVYFPLAACLAEDRHWSKKGPGRYYTEWCSKCNDDATVTCLREGHDHARKWKHRKFPSAPVEEVAGIDSPSRDLVYYKMLNNPPSLDKALEWFQLCEADFCTNSWESGYGGKKWGEVATQHKRLCELVKEFMEAGGKERWTEVMLQLNLALNTSHNNGSVYNKWVFNELLNMAPGLGSLIGCVPFLCELAVDGELDRAEEKAGLMELEKMDNGGECIEESYDDEELMEGDE